MTPGVDGLGLLAVALLLAAGLPRLAWGSPSQRALAGALCSSAGVLALELDQVEHLLADLGAAAFGTLAQCLLVTLAAAAAFGMARQISPAPLPVRLSPAVLGVPVAALQCVLFGLSGSVGAPATGRLFVDHVHRPGVVALWLVTAAGPVVAGVALLPVLRRYGPGLPLRRARFAVACTVAGSVLIAFAGAATAAGLVLAAAGSPALDRLTAAAEPLAPVGLGVVAVGVLTTRLLTAAAPVARWFGDHRALRRLEPLARRLAAAAPEWGISSVADRRTLRDPAGRLYRRVIAVRDASWTLVGLAEDGAVIERAQEFARSRAGPAGDEAVAVLAEACWLRYAVEAAARGARPVDADAARFPERVPEPAGSLREEAAFLVAVARAWHDPWVEEFVEEFVDPPERRHPHLRSA